MSASSEAARELDEARDLSGIDLVECELSFHKDAVEALVKACEKLVKAMVDYEMDVEPEHPAPYSHRQMMEEARAAIAKAKELSPARDAGTST